MKRFHLIARAVIIKDGHVLLAHQKGADNTFLPGGHIEIGESAVAALKREIKEELGLESHVDEYLGAVEAGWKDSGIEHFEINHIFRASIENLPLNSSPKSCEEHLEFLWSPVNDLEKNNLLPDLLQGLIKNYILGDRKTWWESTLLI